MGTSQDRRLLGAAIRGDLAEVASALADGATIDAMARKTGRTALIEAVIEGHPEVVRLLVEAGADTEVHCEAVGLTALGWTAHQPSGFESAQILLTAGAAVDARQTQVHSTPLIGAAREAGNLRLVELLLAYGADPNAINAFGQSALSRAISPAITAVLEQAGAQIPPPLEEPAPIGWPSTDPNRPDHTDPVTLVRGFILAMGSWEYETHTLTSEPGFDRSHFSESIATAANAADPYLTERRRPYRVGSVGIPYRFSASDDLIEVRRPTRSRTELVVRQPRNQLVRRELIFTVLRRADGWWIDQVKQRTLVFEDRYRSML